MRLVRATPSSRASGPSRSWTWPGWARSPTSSRPWPTCSRRRERPGPGWSSGRPEKDRGLKSHPARSFSRRSARKRGKSTGLGASRPFLPGRDPEGRRGVRSPGNGDAGTGGTDDSWSLRLRYGRGYRETLTLPRGPEPWPTTPSGTATAAPTLALTAVRALRESWPAPSTRTCAAGARDFLQDQGPFHSDQDQRSPTHPVKSACSGSPSTSVTRCNDMRKIAAC